jgi:hypothetical protein
MNSIRDISPVVNSVYRIIPVTILLCYLFAYYSSIKAQTDTLSVTWYLDRLENIGGLPTTKLSNQASGPASEYPLIVDSPFGKAAYFNGINEGILVPGNPLGSSPSFTIEILFKPEAGPKNDEKRFIHIRSKNSDSRRILLELTPLLNNLWTFKTFILSEKNSLDVIDSLQYTHEFNQWYHAALVYEKGKMHNYINWVHESSGEVTYIPIENGQISIGARQDPKSWLKGTIGFIKFSRKALSPSEFTGIPKKEFEILEKGLGILKNQIGIPEKEFEILEKQFEILEKGLGILKNQIGIPEKELGILEKGFEILKNQIGIPEFSPKIRKFRGFWNSSPGPF